MCGGDKNFLSLVSRPNKFGAPCPSHVRHASRERQKGSSMLRIRTAVSGWTSKPEPLTVLWVVPRRPIVLALHDSRVARSASG